MCCCCVYKKPDEDEEDDFLKREETVFDDKNVLRFFELNFCLFFIMKTER